MIPQKKARAKRLLQGIIITLILCLVSSALATKIVYDSVFTRYDSSKEITEEELLTLMEGRLAHSFSCEDNLLCGWLYPADGHSLVVIAPGFRSCCDDYLPLIKSFNEHGRDVFIFDNTGSCHSEGESAVGFPQATADLTAALDYIEKAFDYGDLFLFGHSRGGYAVCCALAERDDVTAAVAVSGIDSAMDAVIGPAKDKVGPLAYTNYPLLWLYQAILFDPQAASMSASDELDKTDVPVLIVHAKNDETVPLDERSIIAHRDEMDTGDVEFLVCDAPGRDGHTSILYSEEGENRLLMDAVNDFFDGFEKTN